MTSNIKQARIDYVLDTRLDFDGLIQTRREWLHGHAKAGFKAELGDSIPKLNSRSDKHHKPSREYRLLSSESSFWVVTKIEYEYYLSLDKGSSEVSEIEADPYQKVLKIPGVAELLEKLEAEQDEDLWWVTAKELSSFLTVQELRAVDEKHDWNLVD